MPLPVALLAVGIQTGAWSRATPLLLISWPLSDNPIMQASGPVSNCSEQHNGAHQLSNRDPTLSFHVTFNT
jgi:hypothetical protein